METDEFKTQYSKAFQDFAQEKNKPLDEMMRVVKIILFTIHGLLTLYISNNESLTKDDVYKELDTAIYTVLSDFSSGEPLS